MNYYDLRSLSVSKKYYENKRIPSKLYTYTTLYIHNSGSVGLVTKSCATLATSWTVAHEAPLSMGFPRQEYWSGLPFPPPEDFPDPGIEPRSHALQADSLQLSHWGSPMYNSNCIQKAT